MGGRTKLGIVMTMVVLSIIFIVSESPLAFSLSLHEIHLEGVLTSSTHLPCTTCDPDSTDPPFDGVNQNIRDGDTFEITYVFDADAPTSFFCDDEFCREADYDQNNTLSVTFQSGQAYNDNSIFSRIFVNDNDPFYADVFEIQFPNLGANPVDPNPSDSTSAPLTFLNIEVSDNTMQMLSSLDLPTNGDFFANRSDDFVSFGFNSAQALGQIQNFTINPLNFVDNDNDGFTSDVDCDDSNENVNPSATEIFDGIDNNCDGKIDEGFADLEITKILAPDTPSTILMNETITYFINVTNHGPDTAFDVRWLDTLDNEYDQFTQDIEPFLQEDSNRNPSCFDTNSFWTICDVDYLLKDETWHLKMTVVEKPNEFWGNNTDFIRNNTAHILESTPVDPNLSNNKVTVLGPNLFNKDTDGDGYHDVSVGGSDCDDNDPGVNRMTPEILDGEDNNCNGMIDEPDIILTKNSNQTFVEPGKTFTYMVNVTNIGATNAQDVVFFDTIIGPANITSVTPNPPCSLIPGGVSIRCDLGVVMPGEENKISIDMQVKILENAMNGTLFENIYFSTSSSPDANPANNQGPLKFLGPFIPVVDDPPDFESFQFIKQDIDLNLGDLLPGEILSYTISILNRLNQDTIPNGQQNEFEDMIPSNTAYVANSLVVNGISEDDNVADGIGYNSTENKIVWNGVIPQGHFLNIVYQVKVDESIESPLIISNQAFFNLVDFSTPSDDPNTSAIDDPTNSTVTIPPMDSCSPPISGDWIISENCELSSNKVSNGSVIISNGAVLTIPSGITLTIPSGENITVQPGGGVLIKNGGTLQINS